jgi:chondroitin AC lyase
MRTKFNYHIRGTTIWTIIFFFALFIESASAQTCDFSTILKRVQEDQRSGIKWVGTTDEWVSSQNTDGSWDDVTYGKLSSSVGTGKVGDHVGRLWHISAAASESNHSRYNNSGYKEAVKKGLEFWYGSNTVDPNWWYNQIDFPQKLGEILIFMREFEGFIPVTSSEGIDEQKVISLFYPQEIKDITSWSTGANAIDISQHYIYRGLLTEDCSLLEKTRDRLEEILVVNIKDDLVYQDHGPQIQISSYGKVFCNGLLRLASYLAGSPAEFDVESENFGKVIGFIRETQISSIRGTCWDFSVMGREVSRSGALNGNLNYLQTLIDFKIDSTNNSIYQDALERMKGKKPADYNVREFNKHYWASDYTQHARSGYLFTVRNVSTRTVEAESGNGENLKANYFSYGANFISVDGNEYKNIMPYWDWSMIPGTTFPHTTEFPTRSNWGSNYGKTSFVGGVSDGLHGAATLDMNEGTTKGKKSWFFFEDEIVCLGAGISDNSGKNVRTTINQNKIEYPSYSSEVGSASETIQRISSSTYSNSNLYYIRNGNFGYFFPEQGNIRYTMKLQSGRWRDINNNGSTNLVSGNVFTLWVDHETNPDNASYSYIVVPGIDSKEKARAYDLASIEIIENSSAIQAVLHKSLDVLQVVFHQAGTLTHAKHSITVDNPCALLLKNGSLVSVSDPAQSKSNIAVSVNYNGVVYEKNISLPISNGMRGASVTIDFEIPTGTSMIHKKQDLQISCVPNPTSGLLYLSTNSGSPLKIEINNINGQKIFSNHFEKQTTIDLTGNPSGTYFLSVFGHTQSYNQKILIF